jgi:ankyrin repeat protein
MDIFIIKSRLKLTLWLVGMALVAGLLGSFYAWTQIDLVVGEENFLLATVLTGALGLVWVVLLILFLSASRFMQSRRVENSHWWDHIPWWLLSCITLLVLIGTIAATLPRLSLLAKNEFTLLHDGEFEQLAKRIMDEPELLEGKEYLSGKTLLELALESGDPDALDTLLAYGATLESVTNIQHQVVISLDNLPVLETLLKYGADPNLPDSKGMAPLFYAVVARNTNAIATLINAGATIDVRNPVGQTPLLVAILVDDLPMAENLVNHDANPDLHDRHGDTALHKSVKQKNIKACRFLLENRADAKLLNLNDRAPLHLAALNGQNDFVELFLEQSELIELRNEGGSTAFDYALRGRKYETMKLLLDHGYNVDRVLTNGYTATHLIIIEKDYKAAQFLIEAGADVHISSPDGETSYSLMQKKQLSILLEKVK